MNSSHGTYRCLCWHYLLLRSLRTKSILQDRWIPKQGHIYVSVTSWITRLNVNFTAIHFPSYRSSMFFSPLVHLQSSSSLRQSIRIHHPFNDPQSFPLHTYLLLYTNAWSALIPLFHVVHSPSNLSICTLYPSLHPSNLSEHLRFLPSHSTLFFLFICLSSPFLCVHFRND